MNFIESFRNLFKKKEDGTEKRRQQIENSLHAKIKNEREQYRESTFKKLSLEDIDKANEEAKKKEMRVLIDKKREETKKADLVKKQNKTLSSNF